MAKNEFDNETGEELTGKKKNPAVLGLLIFVSVVAIIVLLVWAVVIPIINKNLSNIGIKSVNEFIDFYKEINSYVAESEVVTKPFSSADYSSAYEKFINQNLKIFENDEVVSALDAEKINDYKEHGFPNYGSITLTAKEFASLMANALGNKNLIKELDVEIIEKYKLSLEIKEISTEKIENIDDETEKYNLKTVGKISLKDVASSLPWPYNGMIPDSIYITVESKIKYEGEETVFTEPEIQINKISEKTHQTIIDVVNSQIKDKNIDPITLDELSQNINKIIYEKIESFASMLSGKIKMICDDEGNVLFELKYIENIA